MQPNPSSSVPALDDGRNNFQVSVRVVYAHLLVTSAQVRGYNLSLCHTEKTLRFEEIMQHIPSDETGWDTVCISRVPDQNGVSQAWYLVEIHHSGWKPSILACVSLAAYCLSLFLDPYE